MSSNITGTGNSITGNSTIRNNNTASNSSNSSNSTKVLILSDALLITPDPSIYGPYPYNGLQILAFAILAFFPALSLAVCGLRVHSRVLSKKKFTLGILYSLSLFYISPHYTTRKTNSLKT